MCANRQCQLETDSTRNEQGPRARARLRGHRWGMANSCRSAAVLRLLGDGSLTANGMPPQFAGSFQNRRQLWLWQSGSIWESIPHQVGDRLALSTIKVRWKLVGANSDSNPLRRQQR
jgi:hypothetical protein